MTAKEFSSKTGSEIRQLVKKMSVAELDALNDEINKLEGIETDQEQIKRLQRAGWAAYQEMSNRR